MKITVHIVYLRDRESYSPSLRAEKSHKLFCILLYGRFIYFPHLCVYSLIMVAFNHSSYISINSWTVFYTLSYNSTLCYLFSFCSNVPVLIIGRSFSFVPLWYASIVLFFEHFLLSGTKGYSMLILYSCSPGAELRHLSKHPWFLLMKNGIRN